MTKRTNIFVAFLLAATCGSSAVYAETSASMIPSSAPNGINLATVQDTLSAEHNFADSYQNTDLRFESMGRSMNVISLIAEGDWSSSGKSSQISNFRIDLADIRQETLDGPMNAIWLVSGMSH